MKQSVKGVRMESTALARICAARQALVEAKGLQETMEIRDRAAAMVAYAEAKGATEAAQLAKEIQIRAERKAGEFLGEMEKHPGTRPVGPSTMKAPSDPPPTLSELGISYAHSHRMQTIARMPEEEFEECISKIKEEGSELTSKGIYREARRTLQPDIQPTPALPSTQYRILYADPPWKYSDLRERLPEYGPARGHYPVMSVEELCALPILGLALHDSVLFLWTTSPLLEEAFSVIHAWGFEYKASFVWDKVKHNYGHYNSVRHEFLLLCTRGSCLPDSKELHDSVISIPRTSEHSQKPEEFRTLIDELYPTGRRIELFARGAVRGEWQFWGAEAEGSGEVR